MPKPKKIKKIQGNKKVTKEKKSNSKNRKKNSRKSKESRERRGVREKRDSKTDDKQPRIECANEPPTSELTQEEYDKQQRKERFFRRF